MAPTGDYEGLTEEELQAFLEDSAQRPEEDASEWAARAATDAAKYKALAAERRAAQTADGLTPGESSDPGTEGGHEGQTGNEPVAN